MSKTKNHTLDTVCRELGGTVNVYGIGGHNGHEASIDNCFGHCISAAEGQTEAAAIAALEVKLRECAMAVLSDEWEFGQ